MQVQFVNPYVPPNTMLFTLQVWLPNVLYNNPPQWTTIYIGNGIPTYGSPTLVKADSCNNLAYYNYSQPPQQYVAVSDPVGLQTYFNNWVSTNHTLFFQNTSFGPLLYALLGRSSVKNGSIDISVNLDSTSNWVIHQISGNVNDFVTNCYTKGATEINLGSTDQLYTLPITVAQRNYDNTYIQSTSTFFLDFSLTGQLNSITASSHYTPQINTLEIITVTTGCPAGQAKLYTVYQLTISNVYSANTFVGPRTAADIVWTSQEVGNALWNCYGESVVNITRMYTLNTVSYTQITTQTHCRPIDPSGQSFNNCSFATAADKQIDLGSSTASYPSSLNSVHDFFVYEYLCPHAANANNNWQNCTQTVLSPNGWPDHIYSTIGITVYPGQAIVVQFDVIAGLLPSPFVTDLSRIDTLSQTPNTVISTPDLYNSNLQWNGQFSFVVCIADPTMRGIANLTLDTATLFRIDGLDTNGTVIPGLNSLYISQVFPYMTYVPQSLLANCRSYGCQQAPATINVTGCDSFSVPVITLRTLLPANGYAVSVAYKYTLPTSVNAVSFSAGMHTYALNDTKAMQALAEHKGHLHKFEPASNSKVKSSKVSVKAAEPVPNGGVTLHTGSYLFRFLISDTGNPSPISTDPAVLISSQPGNNQTNATITLIYGMQVAFRVFVTSDAVGITDPHNTTQLSLYTKSHVGIAVAATLDIPLRQILDVRASDAPDTNSITTLSHRFALSSFDTQTTAIGSPIYVSLVLIEDQLLNATALQLTPLELATLLISTSSRSLLEANLLLAGLQFDTTWQCCPPPVQVVVSSSLLHNDNNIQVIVASSTENKLSLSDVSIVSIVLGFALACMLLYVIWEPCRQCAADRDRHSKHKSTSSASDESCCNSSCCGCFCGCRKHKYREV